MPAHFLLRHIRFVSLVNLIIDGFTGQLPAEEPAVRELLGYKLTPDSLHHELVALLGESAERKRVLAYYERMAQSLGDPGAPVRAASAILARLGR